ncbi:MAG: hypothetical protein ACLTBR_02880 [Anaerostipes sp.]|uniref:hypothetical protein n=1 Tax=Anaerostipes sp. TaxID=1872530 RepID=UPI003994D9AC
MSYYLSKYVGKYRLKSHIDRSTNDYPRDDKGFIEQNDVYIKCKNKGEIYHYGRSKLVCYIPSLGRGRNILKRMAVDLGLKLEDYIEEKGKIQVFNYNSMYNDIMSKFNMIFDIEETDGEVLWKFDNKNMEFIEKYMQPLTSGASISPFSTRNLPKIKYEINNDDLLDYKKIINSKELDSKLEVGRLTNKFIIEIIPKKHKEYSKVNMKALMKEKMLKGKEFIHSVGFWDEYLNYLDEAL